MSNENNFFFFLLPFFLNGTLARISLKYIYGITSFVLNHFVF